MEEEIDQWCARRKTPGVVEHKSAQWAAVREVWGVVEHKSEKRAAAREVLGVVEHKSAQQAAARDVPGVIESRNQGDIDAAAMSSKRFFVYHINLYSYIKFRIRILCVLLYWRPYMCMYQLLIYS